MKKHLYLILPVVLGLSSCVDGHSGNNGNSFDYQVPISIDSASSDIFTPPTSNIDSDVLEKTDASITFQNDRIVFSGSAAQGIVNAREITILAGGTYHLSGSLQDGRIIVEVGKEENVRLILDNVTMTSNKNAPIYVKQAKNAKIYLLEGTTNTLSDALTYTYDDVTNQEPNACLFAKDDLIIEGNGELIVNGRFANGIQSKDDVNINGGTIRVNAVNNGVKGKDSVTFLNSHAIINTNGDGIQATNTLDATTGYITVDNAFLEIESQEDGIQAESYINVNSGEISIKTGNGSASAVTVTSQKGLKCTNEIIINGARITIDSQDDCLHANNDIVINGGILQLKAGDDGIHADRVITINNGTTTIEKADEGIEAYTIYLCGGINKVTASDDGINAAGGSDNTLAQKNAPGGGPGGGGHGGGSSTSDGYLEISGGYNVIDASGDGLDSNGKILVKGGVTIVGGPTSSANGALDYGDKSGDYAAFEGGTLMATGAGNSDMPAGFSSSYSSKYSILARLTSQVAAGSLITLLDSNENVVLCYKTMKTTKSIVMASEEINTGTYYLYTGGNYEGELVNNYFYINGQYTKGQLAYTINVNAYATSVGSSGGFGH